MAGPSGFLVAAASGFSAPRFARFADTGVWFFAGASFFASVLGSGFDNEVIAGEAVAVDGKVPEGEVLEGTVGVVSCAFVAGDFVAEEAVSEGMTDAIMVFGSFTTTRMVCTC